MSQPRINLDWNVMWCSVHLEPFRADWPKGAVIAMVELVQRALAMPAISDAADNDANNIDKALKRFAPVCCFVSFEDLQAVYAASGIDP